jgi:hypothetical protein
MIKATATLGDRQLLMIGLSFGNLGKFLAEPLDTFIKIDGEEMNLPFDVMIFSGKTEADMQGFMASSIGPLTKVHIDPKLP